MITLYLLGSKSTKISNEHTRKLYEKDSLKYILSKLYAPNFCSPVNLLFYDVTRQGKNQCFDYIHSNQGGFPCRMCKFRIDAVKP